MPKIIVNNASLYYEDSDPNSDKPVMLFAHGLLWNTHLYDNQVAYFKDRYRCITFDFRGQGQSEVTKSGYDMDSLTEDVIGLLDKLGIKSCHFVGLSMGGFVGQRIAIHYPSRIDSLTLLNTSAEAEDKEKIADYSKLLLALKLIGIKRVSKKIMPIMFAEEFLADKSKKALQKTWRGYLNNNKKKGAVRATKALIAREGVLDKLNQVDLPTLIIAGSHDAAFEYTKAERIHFAIKGSKLAIIEGAGHTSTVEKPEAVNKTIERFLQLVG